MIIERQSVIDALWHPDSWLRRPLPSNWAVHSNSAAGVATVVNQVYNLGVYPNININSWTADIHVVPADQPLVPVYANPGTQLDQGYAVNLRAVLGLGVPIPTGWVPTNDGDATGCFAQPDWQNTIAGTLRQGRYFELWAVKTPDQNEARGLGRIWSASWGGRVSDTRNRKDGHPRDYWWQDSVTNNNRWTSWGIGEEHAWLAKATGLPFSHTIVRKDDLQRGSIDHPIGFMLTTGPTAPAVWPAQRCDSGSRPEIPQGSRLALPPGYPIDPTWTPLKQMFVRCMRDHGLVFDDTAGNFAIRAETGTRSYFPASIPDFLRSLPWADLRVLKVGTDYNQTPTA